MKLARSHGHAYVLFLSRRPRNSILFLSLPRDKRRAKEYAVAYERVAGVRARSPVGIKVGLKLRRVGMRVEKALRRRAFEIAKEMQSCLPMRFEGGTNKLIELLNPISDVRSRKIKVKEATNHASVTGRVLKERAKINGEFEAFRQGSRGRAGT